VLFSCLKHAELGAALRRRRIGVQLMVLALHRLRRSSSGIWGETYGIRALLLEKEIEADERPQAEANA